MTENYSPELVNALKDIVNDCNWKNVGEISSYKEMKCYRFYNLEEIEEDILLIRAKNNVFYAIDARCSHEGGPLDQGDIEELGEKLLIVCPWHSFDFDLKNGQSSTGLKQQTYETKVVDNILYINSSSDISLTKEANKKDEINSSTDTISTTMSNTSLNELKENSLNYQINKLLCTADPKEKVKLTNEISQKWFNNDLEISYKRHQLPDQPERSDSLTIIDPGKIRRGKGGTIASRIALLHSLANIELWAIDLSLDIVSRFSHIEFPDKTTLPKEFFDDFIKVARDEAKHFTLLEKRLTELGSYFGALPVHNGLWESATVTKDNFLSRLAIVHMVHEARGLDVHPQTRQRFKNQNDHESVKLLDILYNDEITHVAAGIKWFQYACKKYNLEFILTFHDLVKKYFKGYLKPPFDTEGRTVAGMTEEWYMPLINSNISASS